MIKIYELGMLDNAVNVPDVKAEADTSNYTFVEHDGEQYLMANTLTGDDAYKEDVVIKEGEYMNLFLVRAWETKELVIDAKHITFGAGESYASITAGTTLLTIATDGTLEIADAAPDAGVYFKVTAKTMLTGEAVRAKIMVA